jgi:predicted nucleic acid-binding protein
LRAADTSLVIAAFASWHESHEAARRALDSGLLLIEHCALEIYSVLTRLPPPHRVSGAVVRAFLEARFPQPWLRLSAPATKQFILELADRGVTGGTTYDALVAATAAGCGADLVTCDRRALPIYERYGVRIQFLP